MIILRIYPIFSHFYRASFLQDGSRHPDVLHKRHFAQFGHYTCAALFIENVCVQFRSDHTILFHSTSSSTSIKQYVQLRLVLENERQTYSEFLLRFPSQTPLLLVHRFRPPFQATTAAPVSGCPAACQTRRQTEESSRSRPCSPRVSYITFRPPVATNVPRSTALNHSLSNSQSVNQVPVTRRCDTRPGTPARRLAACGGASPHTQRVSRHDCISRACPRSAPQQPRALQLQQPAQRAALQASPRHTRPPASPCPAHLHSPRRATRS